MCGASLSKCLYLRLPFVTDAPSLELESKEKDARDVC